MPLKDPANSPRNLLRDASALAGVRLGIRMLGILVGLLVARLLGPEGLGQLSIPNLMLSIGPFIGLGFADGLVRELPRAETRGESAADLRSAAWSFSLMMGLLALLLAFGPLRPWVGSWISDGTLLVLALAAALLNGGYKYVYSDLVGSRRIRELGEMQVLQGVLRAVLVLSLLWMLGGRQRIWALHAGASLSFLLSILWVARRVRPLPRFRLNPGALLVLLKSGPGLAAASFGMVLLVTGDRLFLRPVLDHGDMGLFEQAVLIRDALVLLPAVLLTLLIPEYSGRHANPAERARLLADVRRQSATVAVLSPLFLGWLSLQVEWVTALLLPGFLPGVPLYQLTCLGMITIYVCYIPVSLLMSENRSLLVGLAALTSLGLIGVLNSGWLSLALLELPAGASCSPEAWLGVQNALIGFLLFAVLIYGFSLARLELRPLPLAGAITALALAGVLAYQLARGDQGWLVSNALWLGLSLAILWGFDRRTGQVRKMWQARRAKQGEPE